MMKEFLRKAGRWKLNGRQRDGTREELRLSRLHKVEWRKWILMCALWLAEVFMSVSYSMTTPFFPVEAQQKGSGAFTTGVIVSASPLGLMICSPLFGYILPKLGIKFTLISGCVLIGVGVFVMRFLMDLPSGWVFITSAVLMRLSEGVGWAMYQTAAFTYLAQLFPNHVATATAYIEVASSVGYGLGPPIGGLIYGIGGFTLPFTVVGVIILVLALPMLVLLKPKSVSSQLLPLKALLPLLGNLSIVALVLANVSAMIALTYDEPTLEPFLLKEFGLTPLLIGLLYIPYGVIDVPLAMVYGRLSDKFGTRMFIISGLFLAGISLFFVGPADFISKPRLWIILIAFLTVDMGLIAVYVPVYSDMLEEAFLLHPHEDKTGLISVVSGILIFSGSLGEFLGSFLGGVLVEISDFPTSSVVVGELVLSQGFLLLGVTMIGKYNPTKGKLSSKQSEIENRTD